ncbi:hypothetical protein HanRHA438_Chr03g0116311 [Helianthus annuus]|nr:hypothetical protein HanRHA438_Chr03g0116311 [Helianthus annuus]
MYFAATLVTMMVQQWLPESLWFWCLRCYYGGGSGDTYGGGCHCSGNSGNE